MYVSEAREMSDSKTPTRIVKVNRRPPRDNMGPVEPGASAPKHADKIGGRHAAITDNLNSWRNYKHWADKIRGTWEEKK
jgi:hypothetical protein